MPRPLWLKAALVLLAIWLVAGGAIFWARSVKVTPESLAAYVEAHPLAGSGGDRARVLQSVADQMNQLSYEQRREFRMGRKLDGFFRALTPEEQGTFLDRTLPTGFKQMMESLNKMEPPQRKRFVERALRDMKEKEGGDDPNLDQNARKMIDQGFRSFYNDASLETKMDVAPLVEQIQKKSPGLAMKRRAFTLMEILVVVAIIAVLAALLTPVFKRVAATGHAAGCLSNLRQIGIGLSAYLTENNNQMPILKTARASRADEVPVLDNTLDRFLTDPKSFACPADQKFAAVSGTSYVWNVALNGQTLGSLNFIGLVEEYSRIPMIADKEGFHPYTENKVNILYADGHATKELKFVDR